MDFLLFVYVWGKGGGEAGRGRHGVFDVADGCSGDSLRFEGFSMILDSFRWLGSLDGFAHGFSHEFSRRFSRRFL